MNEPSKGNPSFYDKHFLETSDGRRWTSLTAAFSPVLRLSAVDTRTGQTYSAHELLLHAPGNKRPQAGPR